MTTVFLVFDNSLLAASLLPAAPTRKCTPGLLYLDHTKLLSSLKGSGQLAVPGTSSSSGPCQLHPPPGSQLPSSHSNHQLPKSPLPSLGCSWVALTPSCLEKPTHYSTTSMVSLRQLPAELPSALGSLDLGILYSLFYLQSCEPCSLPDGELFKGGAGHLPPGDLYPEHALSPPGKDENRMLPGTG